MTLLALLGFELLRPVDLAWLLIVPAVAVLGVRGLRLSDAEARAMVAPSRLERFFGGLVPGATRLRLGLAVAGLAMLGLAVTGPVRGFTLREVERKGLDLIVALDASKSMLVPDLGRTRLEEAKRQVKALFPRLQGDRVALISFSGEARRIAPLTRDHTTLGWFLDGVDPGDHALGGTDLAAALQEALDLFERYTSFLCVIGEGSKEKSSVTRRIKMFVPFVFTLKASFKSRTARTILLF